jgi:hypothetical protein
MRRLTGSSGRANGGRMSRYAARLFLLSFLLTFGAQAGAPCALGHWQLHVDVRTQEHQHESLRIFRAIEESRFFRVIGTRYVNGPHHRDTLDVDLESIGANEGPAAQETAIASLTRVPGVEATCQPATDSPAQEAPTQEAPPAKGGAPAQGGAESAPRDAAPAPAPRLRRGAVTGTT